MAFQRNSDSGFKDIVNSSNRLQTLGRDGLLFLRFCRWLVVSDLYYTPYLGRWVISMFVIG